MKHPASARPRKTGIIFIVAVLAASLLAWGGIQLAVAANADHRQLQVIDGDGQTHLLPLDQDGSYTFTTSLGTNVVTVADGSARMESSDCPGHDCIDQGSIDNAAEMIICMPHKLIVGIVEDEEN